MTSRRHAEWDFNPAEPHMGRYLHCHLSTSVAYSAPSTCKQFTPQITEICGGARGALALQLQAVALEVSSEPLRRILIRFVVARYDTTLIYVLHGLQRRLTSPNSLTHLSIHIQ